MITVRVHYQNTAADYRSLYRAFPLRKRLGWSFLLPLWLVMVSLPATALLAALGDWWALGAGWLFLAAFVGWVYAGLRRAWRSPDPKFLEPATVWLDEQTVGSESPFGWGRRDWSLIREIRDTPGYLLLFTAEAEALGIPRRAFATPRGADEFSATARRCFARSREPGYAPYSPALPVEVVATPGSATIPTALQVRFQNTAEELATVQFRGLAKIEPWHKRLASWFWLSVFALIIVWLMSVRGEDRWVGQFGSFLAFVSLFFLGLQFWTTLLFWRAKRHTDPSHLTPDVITITPAGVAGRAPSHESWHNWSAFDEIAENDRFVVLYITKPRFLTVIPKTAFASPLEAEQFVHFAREWKKLAAETVTPANAPPRVDTGNPYQSPLEM